MLPQCTQELFTNTSKHNLRATDITGQRCRHSVFIHESQKSGLQWNLEVEENMCRSECVCVCVYIWLGSGGSYYNLFLSKGQRTGDGLRSKHWTKRQSWLKTERVKVKALLSVLSAPNQRGKNSLPKNSEGNRRGDLPIFWVLLSSSHLPLAVQAQEQMNCLSYRPEWS